MTKSLKSIRYLLIIFVLNGFLFSCEKGDIIEAYEFIPLEADDLLIDDPGAYVIQKNRSMFLEARKRFSHKLIYRNHFPPILTITKGADIGITESLFTYLKKRFYEEKMYNRPLFWDSFFPENYYIRFHHRLGE